MNIETLVDNIRERVVEHIEQSELDNNTIAQLMYDNLGGTHMNEMCRVTSKLVAAWRNKKRTLRLYQWPNFQTALDIDNDILLTSYLNSHNRYLMEDFHINYMDIKRLVNYYILKIQYPFFKKTKDDVEQDVFLEIWRRYDDIPDSCAFSNFIYKMCQQVLGRIWKSAHHSIISRGKDNIELLLKMDHRASSLENTIVESDTISDGIVLGDAISHQDHEDDWGIFHEDSEESILHDKIDSEQFVEKLAILDERWKKIVVMRIFEQHTLEEVGAVVNLTRERVRQIQNAALRKLKQELIKSGHGK